MQKENDIKSLFTKTKTKMKFLLYNLDNPLLVVSSVDSDYNPTYVTNEDYAMQFNTVAEADAVGNIINDPIEFVGTRPVRKPK